MAIYHLSVKTLSRSSGRSSVGAAAYRSGERLVNELSGSVHDFRRKQGIGFSAVLLPVGAPFRMASRQHLWNAVEAAETRSNSRTARELVLALPVELAEPEQVELLTGFVRAELVERGMVADVNLHDANSHNPHAHVLLTTREITPSGFGQKVRDWNRVELLSEWREAWAERCNQALADSGSTARVDHRTLSAQGIQREPTRHHGVPGGFSRFKPVQPVTPSPVSDMSPLASAGQPHPDFDTAFQAALSKPISAALLAEMDALNARTGRQQGQARL